MNFKRVAALIGVAVLLTGCSGKDEQKNIVVKDEVIHTTQESSVVDESTAEVESVTEPESEIDSDSSNDISDVSDEEANNIVSGIRDSFNLEVLDDFNVTGHIIDTAGEMLNDEQDNAMVSPLSLDLAMSMAALGAGSDVITELDSYLGVPYQLYGVELGESIREGYFPEEFHFANSIWVNKDRGTGLLENYQKTVKAVMGADAYERSISSEETLNEINSWVDENTNGLIPELFKSPLSPNTFAALINTISFDGKWAEEFDDVSDSDFSNYNDSVSTVETLFGSSESYCETEHYLAFSVDYGEDFDCAKFTGILPKAEGKPLEFYGDELAYISDSANWSWDKDVYYSIPSFEFDYDIDGIVEMLKSHGVESMFEEGADFGKMTNDAVHISDIIQKTKIKLDKEGTQAAVATGMIMTFDSIAIEEPRESIEIYLDRPFYFTINYEEFPVFVGRVNSL